MKNVKINMTKYVYNKLFSISILLIILGIVIITSIFIFNFPDNSKVLSLMTEFGPELLITGVLGLIFDFYKEYENDRKREYAIKELKKCIINICSSIIDFYVILYKVPALVEREVIYEFYNGELKFDFSILSDADIPRGYIDSELVYLGQKLNDICKEYFDFVSLTEVEEIKTNIVPCMRGHIYSKDKEVEKRIYEDKFNSFLKTLLVICQKYDIDQKTWWKL